MEFGIEELKKLVEKAKKMSRKQYLELYEESQKIRGPNGEPSQYEMEQLEKKFNLLAKKWKRETRFCSSIDEMTNHPAYQQIIAMGKMIVPIIIKKLKRQPEHWFVALSKITGQNPIQKENRGNLKAMAMDWICWEASKEWYEY